MTTTTRKLLWIGDAACPSGFARCTHYVLEELRKEWDVSVLGLNYRGDPHVYPYPIYPAALGRSDDGFGIGRLSNLLDQIRPNVVIVQNDPWNLPRYMEQLKNVPTIGVLPVDGLNCRSRELNGLACAIFWTDFGLHQAIKGGYRGPYAVLPLGVDLNLYKPTDRTDARKRFFKPDDFEVLKDVFIVGNVNRNQPRKRMDLTISYFAEWVRSKKIDNAYLSLHVAPTGDAGYDCHQLMVYYGLSNRLILSAPDVWKGISEPELNNNYNTYDVGFTTTQGEGWGLTTMEMMASGIPQIVPDWAALGEWCEDSAVKVPCSEIACTINGINVIGGIMDRYKAIEALDDMYRNESVRILYRQKGLELVSRPEFRWEDIGDKFGTIVGAALNDLGVKAG